jgi:hypothetical protein
MKQVFLRAVSAILALAIVVLGSAMTFAFFRFGLPELWSPYVHAWTAFLILLIMAILVVLCSYSAYRFVRFAVRGA